MNAKTTYIQRISKFKLYFAETCINKIKGYLQLSVEQSTSPGDTMRYHQPLYEERRNTCRVCFYSSCIVYFMWWEKFNSSAGYFA